MVTNRLRLVLARGLELVLPAASGCFECSSTFRCWNGVGSSCRGDLASYLGQILMDVLTLSSQIVMDMHICGFILRKVS